MRLTKLIARKDFLKKSIELKEDEIMINWKKIQILQKQIKTLQSTKSFYLDKPEKEKRK